LQATTSARVPACASSSGTQWHSSARKPPFFLMEAAARGLLDTDLCFGFGWGSWLRCCVSVRRRSWAVATLPDRMGMRCKQPGAGQVALRAAPTAVERAQAAATPEAVVRAVAIPAVPARGQARAVAAVVVVRPQTARFPPSVHSVRSSACLQGVRRLARCVASLSGVGSVFAAHPRCHRPAMESPAAVAETARSRLQARRLRASATPACAPSVRKTVTARRARRIARRCKADSGPPFGNVPNARTSINAQKTGRTVRS
jgi:hypothetical protein